MTIEKLKIYTTEIILDTIPNYLTKAIITSKGRNVKYKDTQTKKWRVILEYDEVIIVEEIKE